MCKRLRGKTLGIAFGGMTYYRSSRVPRVVRLGGFNAEIRLSGEDTDGACEVIEYIGHINPDLSALHYHEQADELIYVVEGRVEVHLSARTFVADQGSTVFVKRGAAHRILNAGDDPIRVLVSHAPAIGAEELLQSVRELSGRDDDLAPMELAGIGAQFDYHALN